MQAELSQVISHSLNACCRGKVLQGVPSRQGGMRGRQVQCGRYAAVKGTLQVSQKLPSLSSARQALPASQAGKVAGTWGHCRYLPFSAFAVCFRG